MKAALLGDIHANLPALEAILLHAKSQGVEAIWNVGDTVGYGAYPEEVVGLIREHNVVSIRGNYDIKVLKFKKKKKKWRRKKRYEKWLAFKWAYENLSRESRAYLAKLPKEHRLVVCGKRVLLTHGSPASNKEHLNPETPLSRYKELAESTHADVILFGHSHIPFSLEVEGVWFINPGSVGRQDDGDARASYAVLQFDEAGLAVQHYRLEYDIERAVTAMRQKGLPEAFAQMMIRGVNLDVVLEDS
jgi:putative phosphoesterase